MRLVRLSLLGLAVILLAVPMTTAAVHGGRNGADMVHTMGAVPVGLGWQTFTWQGATLPVTIDDNPITFTLGRSGGVLRITDAFICGDVFEVWDNGSMIGTTSTPDCGTDPWIGNYDEAFASGLFSRGEFTLAPGNHSIELFLTAGYYDGETYSGGAGLEVLNGTGVPALGRVGMIVLIGALLALGALLVKRLA